MPYEKSQALLRLANELQGTAEGLSLRDMQEKFSVSRRTAERMRDAVCDVFPDVEEVHLGDGYKRWRIRSRRSGAMAPITVDELTTLRSAAVKLRQEGLKDQADMVEGVEAKLRTSCCPMRCSGWRPITRRCWRPRDWSCDRGRGLVLLDR